MAAEEEHGVSPFPHPPVLFYKQFTDDNVKMGRTPAPPSPLNGNYSMFGAKFDTRDAILRPLQKQNIKQLFPEIHDRKVELKKLNRSINVCFLELLDILISNPASPARSQKISDLGFLFINMHHLINEFRPHQARETLKVIMERQKKQREDLVVQIHRDVEEAHSILKECGEFIVQATSTIPHTLKIAQTGMTTSGSDVRGAVGVASGCVVSGSDGSGVRGGATGVGSGKGKTLDTLEGSGAKASGAGGPWKKVEMQDAELCSLVDSLIPTLLDDNIIV